MADPRRQYMQMNVWEQKRHLQESVVLEVLQKPVIWHTGTKGYLTKGGAAYENACREITRTLKNRLSLTLEGELK